jgi:hypothetical protein
VKLAGVREEETSVAEAEEFADVMKSELKKRRQTVEDLVDAVVHQAVFLDSQIVDLLSRLEVVHINRSTHESIEPVLRRLAALATCTVTCLQTGRWDD